ncbi:TetR/AcrR family transcriptional regulator [Streptomyces xanthii]|uniref:TetR/AcrR family transcriptional regulator n=1 Tax=Streptomyces xanthii TaxID=2768069 RepID=A0A7H1BCS3_9ACTN|nr:TetR/AcrR family transcriptional regulator [Streptomyces xanthii]QNS06528.1 TetR/AcrR family transcriptional regulator [Streptomyces xanthii]
MSATPAPETPATAPRGTRTGRPRVTSREQIVAAARRLIDEDGWEKLSMRRLAAELGIGATTLYHHIEGKDDLLVLLLNHYVEQIERPALPEAPRERVVAAAAAMHDALAAWPWAAEILTADGFVGLLDESALWMVEAVLAAAQDHGCTPDRSVEVFRHLWYYTVGEILVRAHSPHRRTDRTPAAFRAAFDADRVPHLAAVAPRWAGLCARDTYPEGLRTFVDGLLGPAGG